MNEEEKEYFRKLIISQKGEKSKLKGETMPFIDSLIEWIEDRKSVIAPNTYIAYMGVTLNHICPFFRREKPLMLTDIDRRLLQRFVNHLAKEGYSKALVLKCHAEVLSHFFRIMYLDGVIERNPTKGVEIPKIITEKKRAYTPPELRKILSVIPDDDPWKIAIYIMIYTGMRRGEVLGLKWDKVDLENSVLYVHRTNTATAGEKTQIKEITKTPSSHRAITIPPILLKLLKAHRERQGECEHVIHQRGRKKRADPKGGKDAPVDPNNFSRKWRMWIRDAGVEQLPIHSLRHFYVTWALNAGISPYEIQCNLGWKDLRMLPTYEDSPQRLETRRKAQNTVADGISRDLSIA